MTKNDMTAIRNYLATVERNEALETAYNAVCKELEKGEEKAAANKKLYAEATPIILAAMSDEPRTCADIYGRCENELPEGFSKHKVQWALTDLLTEQVERIENGREALKYRLK